MQTKLQSMIETCVSIAVGLVVSLLSQLIIFPLLGIHTTLGTNIQIVLYFTVISVIRSYWVRRYFNWRHRNQ